MKSLPLLPPPGSQNKFADMSKCWLLVTMKISVLYTPECSCGIRASQHLKKNIRGQPRDRRPKCRWNAKGDSLGLRHTGLGTCVCGVEKKTSGLHRRLVEFSNCGAWEKREKTGSQKYEMITPLNCGIKVDLTFISFE